MTTAVIRKWGNSLALRIPRDIAAVLDLSEATEVTISTEDGRLVIVPRHAPEYVLDDLLRGCKPVHFRRTTEDREWLGAAAVGKEAL
jgi:antitoxin MazE